jgi:hypothetical protein
LALPLLALPFWLVSLPLGYRYICDEAEKTAEAEIDQEDLVNSWSNSREPSTDSN